MVNQQGIVVNHYAINIRMSGSHRREKTCRNLALLGCTKTFNLSPDIKIFEFLAKKLTEL